MKKLPQIELAETMPFDATQVAESLVKQGEVLEISDTELDDDQNLCRSLAAAFASVGDQPGEKGLEPIIIIIIIELFTCLKRIQNMYKESYCMDQRTNPS